MSDSTIVSNVPSGPNVDSGSPPQNAIFYEGEKVTIKVTTTDLQGGGYKDLQFYVAVDDELNPLPTDSGKFEVSGLAVHPDSMSKIKQSVNGNSDYSIDVVVYGRAPDKATWNVNVTDPMNASLDPLSLPGGNIEYSTLSPSLTIPWGGYKFLPPGNQNPPTLANSLHIEAYQIEDANGAIAKQFSAFIQIGQDSVLESLSDLNFFVKSATGFTQIQPVEPDKKVLWLDSDATGKFDFYVSANISQDIALLADLKMNVGTQNVPLPQLVIVDYSSIPYDAQTDAPSIEGAGATYTVDSRPIGVIVPKSAMPVNRGDIQYGDTLFLIVNEDLLPDSGRQYNSDTEALVAAGLPFFHISPNKLIVSQDGTQNTMAYLILREHNKPTKSSIYNFKAITGDLGAGDNPPYPSDSNYDALTIEGFAANVTLGADDVKSGLTAKIDWTNWSNPPQAGDRLEVLGFVVGYDRHQRLFTPIIQVLSDPITQPDIDTKGYIEVPIPPQHLFGWGRSSGGDKSSVIFQYVVDPLTTPKYSDISTYYLLTLPAGGV